MSSPSEIDALIVRRIRDGDGDAWCDLIARYEGRLLAFAQSRLGRRAPSEDVVQETFIGFVNKAGHRYKAPVPEGEEIELPLWDEDTRKWVKIRTWDTLLAIHILFKKNQEELAKLA